jgi:LmbE family N-acetylglucosaminyl deacetylase
MTRNLLAIGAHLDDIELGCSGTILKLSKKYVLNILIASDSQIEDPLGKIVRKKKDALKEFAQSNKILKAKNVFFLNHKTNELSTESKLETGLRYYIEKLNPFIVFTHSVNDIHSDHFAVAKKSISAARHVDNIFMYQSNFCYGPSNFNPNIFVNITREFNKKMSSIRCYKKELSRVNNKWIKQIKNLNSYYGSNINCDYAEAFETFKSNLLLSI